jgi:2-haloacid dehalogenase
LPCSASSPAHNADLEHAAKTGMRTAFVSRPTEYGPDQDFDFEAEGDWDVVADDFVDLATKLGV